VKVWSRNTLHLRGDETLVLYRVQPHCGLRRRFRPEIWSRCERLSRRVGPPASHHDLGHNIIRSFQVSFRTLSDIPRRTRGDVVRHASRQRDHIALWSCPEAGPRRHAQAGSSTCPSNQAREGRILEQITSTLQRGGNVLLPSDSTGRVLELMIVLDECDPSPYTRLPCTLLPTPCTLHPAPHTLHHTPCTIHPTPYTLHPAPCTMHPARYTQQRKAVHASTRGAVAAAERGATTQNVFKDFHLNNGSSQGHTLTIWPGLAYVRRIGSTADVVDVCRIGSTADVVDTQHGHMAGTHHQPSRFRQMVHFLFIQKLIFTPRLGHLKL